MPVYNASLYLDETIQSILNQTYTNFELIIINDSSTDNSVDIINTWIKKDKRITLINNKYNKGIHGASNTGLDIAQGAYIAKADSDDIQRPYRLETQVNFLTKNKNIGIVGGGYELFGNNYDGIKIFHPSNSLRLAWRFISDIYFCNPSVMFRKEILNTVPHYPEVPCEDFAFLAKAIKKHAGFNIHKILLDYRQHGSNYSNTAKENIDKSVYTIFEDNYKYYTGSLNDSEMFYKFHSKKELELRNVYKIATISLKIIKKLVNQYPSGNTITKYIYLLSLVKIEIIKTLARTYIKKIIN